MPASEGGPRAQVHHPLACVDASAQLGRVGLLRRCQVYRCRTGEVGRPHVRVVHRVGVESCQEGPDEVLLLLPEGRVLRALLLDGRGRPGRRRRRAEAAEAVRREHCGLRRQVGGELADRGVLRAAEVLGESGVDQVGAPDGAEQHRAAREDQHWAIGSADGERDVVRGVAGGADRTDRHAPDLLDVLVADHDPLVRHLGLAGHEVGHPAAAGQLETTTDVVVVGVRLGHCGEDHAALGQHGVDAVEVALRVDNQRASPVVDDVAAVAQVGRLDDGDGQSVALEDLVGHADLLRWLSH